MNVFEEKLSESVIRYPEMNYVSYFTHLYEGKPLSALTAPIQNS